MKLHNIDIGRLVVTAKQGVEFEDAFREAVGLALCNKQEISFYYEGEEHVIKPKDVITTVGSELFKFEW